jgi:microsomal prostaglandin-E synthase 2
MAAGFLHALRDGPKFWRLLGRGAGASVSGALCLAGASLALERQTVCHAKTFATLPSAAPGAAASSALSIRGLTLYQYEICPFCNKVKSVLDYFDVPYSTIDVNPLTKSELKFSEYKKVPVLTAATPEHQVNDSAEILTFVLAELRAAGALPERGEASFDSDEAERWAQWCDKELAVYTYPNITRSLSESFEAFGYVDDVPHFSALDKLSIRYLGSVAMLMAQGKIKKKYGIVDERAEMVGKFDEWADAVGGRCFHGGDQPNLADLCVFGCIRGIKGTTTFEHIMEHTEIRPWYQVRAALDRPPSARSRLLESEAPCPRAVAGHRDRTRESPRRTARCQRARSDVSPSPCARDRSMAPLFLCLSLSPSLLFPSWCSAIGLSHGHLALVMPARACPRARTNNGHVAMGPISCDHGARGSVAARRGSRRQLVTRQPHVKSTLAAQLVLYSSAGLRTYAHCLRCLHGHDHEYNLRN